MDPALMVNGTDYPPGVGRANGWKNGQPNHPWTMAEQSAYWMDGMTRLGLVLNDTALKARTAEDIVAVIEGGVLNEPTGGPEGWPRSVYSRAMLAYLDATGDKRVLDLFAKVWNASYTMDAEKDARSLTQAEAMLEGYAYGGSEVLLATALRGLIAHQARSIGELSFLRLHSPLQDLDFRSKSLLSIEVLWFLYNNQASFQQAWNAPRCNDYTVNSSCVTASYELEHGVISPTTSFFPVKRTIKMWDPPPDFLDFSIEKQELWGDQALHGTSSQRSGRSPPRGLARSMQRG